LEGKTMNLEVLGRRTGLSAGLFGCAIAWAEIGWMIAAIKRCTFAEALVAFAAITVIGLLSGGILMRLQACTQVDDILEKLNTNQALFKRQVMWSGLKYLCLSWIGILGIELLAKQLFFCK